MGKDGELCTSIAVFHCKKDSSPLPIQQLLILVRCMSQEAAKGAFEERIDLRGILWDAELVKLVNSWHKNSTHRLRPYHSSIQNVEREAEDAISDDLIWGIWSLGIVLAYSHFVVFQNSWAYCKSHLMTVSMLSGNEQRSQSAELEILSVFLKF